MTTTAAYALKPRPAQMAAEDFLALPDSKGLELDDGRLLERPVGSFSSWVAGQIFFLIQTFLKNNPIGRVWPEGTMYQFPGHPNRLRKPDTSFIRNERLPGGRIPNTGAIKIAPDLAVEVISPNDLATDVERKIDQYLDAGVRLIWVINPETRTIRVQRAWGEARSFRGQDEISGDDILPGFSFKVNEVFLPDDQLEIQPASDTAD